MSNAFSLKGYGNEPFSKTEVELPKENDLLMDIDLFDHYTNHPFSLYDGKRLDDMVESIRSNGVFTPIIAREKDNGRYEILSGHNRLEASKKAGLDKIPCVIKHDVSDDEAHMIVLEANIYQRSFSELSESKKAEIINAHFELIKRQGKRTDLVNDVENYSEETDGNKKTSREIIGEQYNLSNDSIRRYIKLHHLLLKCKDFKDMVDEKEIALRSAYYLSYIEETNLRMLYEFLDNNGKKIDIEKAKAMKQLSESGEFTEENLHNLYVHNSKEKNTTKQKTIRLKRDKIKSYFKEDDSEETIENTIITALVYYFENQKNEEQQ